MRLDAFTQEVHRDIPLSRHMEFSFRDFECQPGKGAKLFTDLPLRPNINDKQTAFGGSIATLATLSGWSLCTLISRHLGCPSQVVVYHSEQYYNAPIDEDFYSLATIDANALEAFQRDLTAHKKAKLSVTVDIYPTQNETKQAPAGRYTGKYLANFN